MGQKQPQWYTRPGDQCSSKTTKELLKELFTQEGWAYRHTGNGHIQARHHQTGVRISLAATPRMGNRTIENDRAQVRRAQRQVDALLEGGETDEAGAKDPIRT